MTGEHTIEPKQSGLRWDWGWVKQWSFIFIINLGIPFLFGLHYIRDGGAIGLAFGILAMISRIASDLLDLGSCRSAFAFFAIDCPVQVVERRQPIALDANAKVRR